MPAWQPQSPNWCRGLPDGHGHAWLSADHPRWRRRKAKTAKSGLQLPKAFNFMLWRSRGAIGRVRAAPGAPATAAEGMDGSDDRADGIPGGGKGLKREP